MSYELFRIQCDSILLHLALEARKPQPKYPAGTVIDGVNVGGKWMPLDDKGTQTDGNNPRVKSIAELLPMLQKNIALPTKGLTPEQQKTILAQARTLVAAPEVKSEINRIGMIFKDIHQSLGDGWNQTVKIIEEELGIAKNGLKQVKDVVVKNSTEDNFKRIRERVSLLVKATKARPDLVGLAALGALELVALSAINLAVDFALKKIFFPKKVLLSALVSLGTIAPKIAVLGDGLLNLTSAFEHLDMEADQQEKAELLRTKLFGDNLESTTLSSRAIRVLVDNDIDIEEIDSALKREKARGYQNRTHSFANRIEEYVELVSAKNTWDYSVDAKLAVMSPVTLETKRYLVGKALSHNKESRDLILERLTETEGSEISIEDSLANSIEWHKGIIDAEIKYGEQLDAVSKIPLINVFSNKTAGVYKDFISVVKKGKTGKVQIRTVDDKFIKESPFRDNPDAKFYGEGFEADFLEPKLVNIKKRIDEVSESSKIIASLSNIDLKTVVIGHGKGLVPNDKTSGTNDGSRGFALQIDNDLTYIEVGLMHDNVFLGFHETGHVLERHSQKLSQISGDYVENGRSIIGRSKNIDGIAAMRTDFPDQYVGKIYHRSDGTIRSTEVISSGCQELSTPERLHRLTITDPDYLRYILYALDRKS